MRRTILGGLWIAVAVVSLMLAVPTYAYSGANGGNGGLGNGMGTNTQGMHDGISANGYSTKMYVQSNDGATRTKAMPNNEVSVYGTGTGSQFFNVNGNTSGATDRNPMYRPQSYTNGGYRVLETNSSSNMKWGWLGLLGLIGLFGIRSRNPQRDR